jgi:hypothetical protein
MSIAPLVDSDNLGKYLNILSSAWIILTHCHRQVT